MNMITSIGQLLVVNLSALFIGHSLVSPTLPMMMSDLLGQDLRYQIINGAPLQINWEESSKAEGEDGRASLAQNPVDVLVMTERVPLAGTIEWHDSAKYAREWADLAASANPKVRPYIYETWHSLNSGTGIEVPYDPDAHLPWRQRLDRDLSLWKSIVTDANAGRPAEYEPIRLIPAGQAMARLSDAIDAGRVPGFTSIRQLFRDDIHPTDVGFYFVALVHYAVLTGESPVGLRADLKNAWGNPYQMPTSEQARILQEIAAETVRDFKD